MKRRAAVPAVLLVALLFGTLRAQNIDIVAGAGNAVIKGGNLIAARQEALRQARRAALAAAAASAVGALESAEKRNQIENSILTEPDRYIVSYEITKDKAGEGVYEVAVEAKVEMDRLTRAIRAISPPRAQPDKKVLLVLITHEKETGFERFAELESQLASRFEIYGLSPAEPRTASEILKSETFAEAAKLRFDRAADLAGTYGLNFFLLGVGTLGRPTDKCPNLVQFYFVDLKRRDVLAKFAYKLKSGLTCDASSKEAAEPIFAKLIEGIAGKGVIDEAGAGKLAVVVLGMKEFADIARVRKAVGGIPAVRKIVMESFATGGDVRFQVEFDGRPEDLAAAIVKIEDDKFHLREAAGPSDRLTFRASY